MPRPSMAAQRRTEILDAFEQCILQHGIAGTSLEMLAEQANMKRSILRHYIGNRDEIIEALGQRWFDIYEQQWQQTLDYLGTDNRLEVLLDILFCERDQAYVDSLIIGEALFIEGKRLPGLKAKLQQSMDRFIAITSEEIAKNQPNQLPERYRTQAHGLHAIYMMSESLLALGAPDDIVHLKQSARLLLRLPSSDETTGIENQP